MRVLLISDHFGFGGVATVCNNLALGLQKKNINVELLSLLSDRESEVIAPELPLHKFSFARLQRLLIFPVVFRLVKFLQTHPYDIVISNKDHVNVYVILAKLLSKKRIVVICNSHNTVSQIYQHTSRPIMKLVLNLGKFLYKKADVVANVSQGACCDSEQFFGLDKVHYLPNPVMVKSDQGESDTVEFNGDLVNIVAIGRLGFQKNFQLMLKSFAVAARYNQNLRLSILGEGTDKQNLIDLCNKLLISDKVNFCGTTNNVASYLRKADFLWSTSRFEGFGMVIVEALACGCPVLAVDCPFGPGEILQDGHGKLVHSFSVLPNALAVLSFSKESKKPYSFYLDRAKQYDLDSCVTRYLTLFSELK